MQVGEQKQEIVRHLDNFLSEHNPELAEQVGKLAQEKSAAFVEMLQGKFEACFKGEINFACKSKVPEDMHMVIDTVPGYKRPFLYRVPNAYKEEVDKKIQEMLDKGMIQLSSSAYASPITCALKKNGTMRLCGDFRAINRVTIPDEYPLPRIDNIKQTVRGNLFSAIDLKGGVLSDSDQTGTPT